MGIQGLLPFLKSIQRSSHIKDWAGQTLAIDAYVWLHRAAYGCAQELCLGIRTTKHIDYVMSRIDLLRRHGVIPYVVFDGDALPGKRGTEEQREKRRQQNLTLAQALLTSGKTEEAREAFAKAVDITPQLAHDVILSLEKAGVKYLVAPYEADAQLRFLERNGDVDGIITEDSDLLVYGARNVLFKLDQVGHCVHICRDDFGRVADTQMSLWTDHEFRQMAILSGCDYLPSIPGLGLKKAYQLIRTHKSAERVSRAPPCFIVSDPPYPAKLGAETTGPCAVHYTVHQSNSIRRQSQSPSRLRKTFSPGGANVLIPNRLQSANSHSRSPSSTSVPSTDPRGIAGLWGDLGR